MRYAIIAAGEGSRLVQEGIKTPKPLVEVGGEKLIDRLIRIFLANGASQIVVICNEQMKEVSAHLTSIRQTEQIPLQLVVKSTPSSMHSMWELGRWLDDEPFVLTTVDTVFREQEFSEYVGTFQKQLKEGVLEGLMGVTDYIDDEKPLYVATNDQLDITAFLDDCCEGVKYVSGGIYGLLPRSLKTLQRCVERGESRMRNFQRALVNDGFLLKAWPFSKVLDIDHVSDFQKAEAFLEMKN